ncbi:MAG: hypothetical protein RLO08_07400 [Parvibaculaceae bacterium]
MMAEEKKDLPARLRKILIEAENAAPEPQALDFAARMAGPIGARLVGCFVENQALIDLVELPFASEVSFSGAVRPLERERLFREWEGQAKQAEAAFAAAAAAAGLDWSFEIKRGKPLFSLLEVAEKEDVVVFNAGGRLTASSDVARAVRAANAEIHADVLLTGNVLRRGTVDVNRPVVVLDDMTSRGEACAHIGRNLAEKAGLTCIPIRSRSTSLQTVAEQVRQLAPGLVIADGASPLFSRDEDVTAFSVLAGCPVLLLGSERDAAA